MTSPDALSMPSAGSDVLARIRYLIKLTRHNQASFGKLIGVDAATVSRILTGKAAPSESFLNRIVVNLGVSKQWLVSGSDVPFPRTTHTGARPRPQGAPVYNIDVTAGSTSLDRMFTDEYVVGRVSLPGLNPDLPIVRVSGNSMDPVITHGSYISVRPLPLDAPVEWGRIHVVVTADHRYVKYLRRNPDPALVTLHSANPDFDDFEISRESIEALYLVENVINNDILA